MLKELRFNLSKHLLDILPLLSAILILPLPEDPLIQRVVLERYLIAIVLFISWRSFRILYSAARSKYKAIWSDYISIIVLAVLTAVLLQLIKTRIPLHWFYSCCLVLFAVFLSDFYEKRGKVLFSSIAKFIYFIALGVLSFVFYMVPVNQVVLVFVFSMSCLSMAQFIALLAYEEKLQLAALDSDLKKRLWTLLYSLNLVLAAVLIIGISVFRFLPSKYCIIAITLPLSGYMISSLNLSDRGNLDLKKFFIDTSGLSIIFIAIMFILKT